MHSFYMAESVHRMLHFHSVIHVNIFLPSPVYVSICMYMRACVRVQKIKEGKQIANYLVKLQVHQIS